HLPAPSEGKIMSTVPTPSVGERHEREQDLVIYSHSPLFYWWPVWAVGFIMTLISMFDKHRMVIVPADAHARTNAEVQYPTDAGKSETLKGRTVLVLPEGTRLDETWPHIARSKNPGVIFVFTVILIIMISSVPLRGLWSIVIMVSVVLLVLLFALLD